VASTNPTEFGETPSIHGQLKQGRATIHWLAFPGIVESGDISLFKKWFPARIVLRTLLRNPSGKAQAARICAHSAGRARERQVNKTRIACMMRKPNIAGQSGERYFRAFG
jgi:hypothetical protein